jgi:hypothetical protein
MKPRAVVDRRKQENEMDSAQTHRENVVFVADTHIPALFDMVVRETVMQRRSRLRAMLEILRVQELPWFRCPSCKLKISCQLLSVNDVERLFYLGKRLNDETVFGVVEDHCKGTFVVCPCCGASGKIHLSYTMCDAAEQAGSAKPSE